MSKSFDVRTKDVKGLTNKEVEEQLNDPESDLRQLAQKSLHKKGVIKNRKANR